MPEMQDGENDFAVHFRLDISPISVQKNCRKQAKAEWQNHRTSEKQILTSRQAANKTQASQINRKIFCIRFCETDGGRD